MRLRLGRRPGGWPSSSPTRPACQLCVEVALSVLPVGDHLVVAVVAVVTPAAAKPGRYKPSDTLLAFLEGL